MIAALYSSRSDGTKDFRRNGVNFVWDTIVIVYESDLYRAQHGTSRRVPGLKYAHIVCDNWTRLNVLPAKIMQVCKLGNGKLYAYYGMYIIMSLFITIATIHAVSY